MTDDDSYRRKVFTAFATEDIGQMIDNLAKAFDVDADTTDAWTELGRPEIRLGILLEMIYQFLENEREMSCSNVKGEWTFTFRYPKKTRWRKDKHDTD